MATPLSAWPLRLVPMGILFVLLLVSLWLMGEAVHNSARFEQIYIWLLLFNTLALCVLTLLISIKLYQAMVRFLRQEPGSRLTLKLVLTFVTLIIIPVLIVYHFSLRFLDEGIDSWFDVRVEKALEDALELSRVSLDLRVRQFARHTQLVAKELTQIPEPLVALRLNELREIVEATELILIGANNRIIAASSGEGIHRLPLLPSAEILQLIALGRDYVGLEPIYEHGFSVRVLVTLPALTHGEETRILQGIFPLATRMSLLADSVQDAFLEYQEFLYLRQPLKQSFTITLSLALLVSVLAGIWAAFYSAKRLVSPITELAEGTRAVAAGEYHKRLSVSSEDELGFLVRSFNSMIATLAATRDEVEYSRRLAESQRTYLEKVLQHLSSGVITLDRHLVLQTANTAAKLILETDLGQHLGKPLPQIGQHHALVGHFYQKLGAHLEDSDIDWFEQIDLFGQDGRKILTCRGVWLPDDAGLRGGHVLVFDDVTELLQAQRDAAWGEVARRLAHEIKNPLTPIQLSAERIEHKLKPHLGLEEMRFLQRYTHTIVQQVEAMKAMVNAFSAYARPPNLELREMDLNELIIEVTELYRHSRVGSQPLQLNLQLADALPRLHADAGRLRQLLHNLIKNGQEALDGVLEPRLTILTRCPGDAQRSAIELIVSDNGPGIPAELLPQLFEPYVTNKHKGTGLGLAVVKKIVEEHGGMVTANNPERGGACITVRLPLKHCAKKELVPA